MSRKQIRPLTAFLAVAALLAFVTVEVVAAPRMNSGSRGNRTYSAPPPTATSPKAAAPIERSMTQPGSPAQSGTSVARPTTPAAQPGGFFNRPGLLGGLAAGFLGAGLIGLLLGNGFLGGLGGIASFLGLLVQVGLVAIVAMLAWRWWQSRSQPAAAFAGGPAMRRMGVSDIQPSASFGGGPVADAPIQVQPADFDEFERTLGEVQNAYSNEDLGTLRKQVTPEMLSYYAEELAANASRNVVNKITDVKLLQGDLAESWREGSDEYATVAMHYRQVDKVMDRASGKMVEGSDEPDEGVEYWTFRRSGGGRWLVSAIQQTN